MTDTQERVDLDVDIEAEPELHQACCVEDRFLCGHPYHPELEIPTDTMEISDGCPACLEISEEMGCANLGILHMHCPLAQRVCPLDVGDGCGLIIFIRGGS